MSDFAERIKPLLLELDETCPLDKPVLISDHLIPLFQKHADTSIDLKGVPASHVMGVHLGISTEKRAIILYQRCEADGEIVDPSCPDCQGMRITVAKELVHTLDEASDKIAPGDAAAMLLDQVVRRAWNESAPANAEGWASIWALELLVRFRHRQLAFHSDGTVASVRLAQARASGDYSYLARQYGVPQSFVVHAFSDSYMAAIREFRTAIGLPITPPPV